MSDYHLIFTSVVSSLAIIIIFISILNSYNESTVPKAIELINKNQEFTWSLVKSALILFFIIFFVYYSGLKGEDFGNAFKSIFNLKDSTEKTPKSGVDIVQFTALVVTVLSGFILFYAKSSMKNLDISREKAENKIVKLLKKVRIHEDKMEERALSNEVLEKKIIHTMNQSKALFVVTKLLDFYDEDTEGGLQNFDALINFIQYNYLTGKKIALKDSIEALSSPDNLEQAKELLSIHGDLKNYCVSLYTLLLDDDSHEAEEIRVIIRIKLAPFVIDN